MSTDYNNTGSLNPAKDKRSDKSPDWYGKLMASGEVLEALKQGKQVRISGWNRDGKYGQFISLKVSVEQGRQETNRNDSAPQKQGAGPSQHAGTVEGNLARHNATEDFDDSIPF
jgi:hypothetical protein